MPSYPTDEFILRYVAAHKQQALFKLLTAKDKRVIKYAVRGVVKEMPGYELRALLMAWQTFGSYQKDG